VDKEGEKINKVEKEGERDTKSEQGMGKRCIE